MSWRLVLPPEAEDEIRQAAAWYESKQPGLGGDFRAKVLGVLRSLETNPYLNSVIDVRRKIRWRRTHRFPYHVIYHIDEANSRVVVAAILHTARDERHWRKRLPKSP